MSVVVPHCASSLLTIPLEIRLHIYGIVFAFATITLDVVKHQSADVGHHSTLLHKLCCPSLSLFTVCKQIYHEAKEAVYAEALFDFATPKFKRSPIKSSDIPDALLGQLRNVMCSMVLANNLLVRKRELFNSGRKTRAEVPELRVVPFREVVVIGNTKLMYALTQPDEASGHLFRPYQTRLCVMHSVERVRYDIRTYLWTIIQLASEEGFVLKIRSGKKELQSRELEVNMRTKVVVVRGIGRRWQSQQVAEKRVLLMLRHLDLSIKFVFEPKQRDDWYEPGTSEWSVRETSKSITRMFRDNPGRMIQFWQSD